MSSFEMTGKLWKTLVILQHIRPILTIQSFNMKSLTVKNDTLQEWSTLNVKNSVGEGQNRNRRDRGEVQTAG